MEEVDDKMMRANAITELTRHRDDLEVNFKRIIDMQRYKASMHFAITDLRWQMFKEKEIEN